jgi:hypothetical protein
MEDRKQYLLLQQFKMTFTQEADCCDSGDGQFLTIRTENGGGGDFYVIETERWAFDNIPELITTLMRFYTKHQQIKSKELE